MNYIQCIILDAQEMTKGKLRIRTNHCSLQKGSISAGSGREDASESGKKRDSSEANEKDGTSLIRDEQEYASEGEAEGVASEGDAGSPEGSAGRREAHWDEEDELEAFLQRNQAGKSGSNSAASDSGSGQLKNLHHDQMVSVKVAREVMQ